MLRAVAAHPWIAAFVVAGYFLTAAGLMSLLNRGVSGWLEQIISAFSAPAMIGLLVWNPLLRRLGLTDGEWIRIPSPWAFVVIVAFYALLAYLISAVVARFLLR